MSRTKKNRPVLQVIEGGRAKAKKIGMDGDFVCICSLRLNHDGDRMSGRKKSRSRIWKILRNIGMGLKGL